MNRQYSTDNPHIHLQRGFTLVELMITLVVTSIIIAAVYSAYKVQQRQYTNQTQVVEMQQNIRAAISFMTEQIRMAGYNPTGNPNAGFSVAKIGRMRFKKDTTNTAGTDPDGDGAFDGPLEDIIFGFASADDATLDGKADSGAASLQMSRDGGANFEPIADNIAAIEFSYILDDGSIVTSTTNYDKIRSITISILARAANQDPEFTNSATYTTGAGNTWTAPGDHYRRRLLITDLKCRNMGL